MNGNVRTFTRRELFDLVWSKPIRKIAEELGISDRGLAKICIRHDVPNPSRGYWARTSAGQKISPPPFREVNNPSLDRITIVATLSGLPDDTREMLRKVKKDRAGRRKSVPDNLPAPLALVEKPHRVIGPTVRELLKAKPDQWGAISATGAGTCGVIVHGDSAHRVIAFLHALATALEADGLPLHLNGSSMEIRAGLDRVTFTVAERTRREKHVPTEEEQALYDRQQAKRQRAADRRNWDVYSTLPYGKPWPEFDTIYTGEFIFKIDSWSNGLRKTWADGKTQTIELMLESILAGLKAILVFEKARREKWEEDERQRVELNRRHGLAQKRKKREERRIAYLRELMQLQREVADIRSWLASLPDTLTADPPAELGRMVHWANKRLSELEARTTIKAADVEVEGMLLFPEVDELHDPLGEPPERKYLW